MKRIIASLLAVTYFGAAAGAADIPARKPVAPAYVPPAFTWTGFYVGVNAGYAFSGGGALKDFSGPEGPVYGGDSPLLMTSSDEGSFTGGAQVGYNYQIGSVVFGAEADFNYANVSKKTTGSYFEETYETYTSGFNTLDIHEIDSGNLNLKSKIEWFGTVRGRLGFVPMDRLMVYATGGLAYGRVKTSADYSAYSYSAWSVTGGGGAFNSPIEEFESGGASKSKMRVGWTIGAGVEYAVTDHLTIKGEYAYVDLGRKHYNFFDSVDEDGDPMYLRVKDKAKMHIIRAGLNYKF